MRLKIQDKFEEVKCDPTQYNITFCMDYNTKECPLTCEYALKSQILTTDDEVDKTYWRRRLNEIVKTGFS